MSGILSSLPFQLLLCYDARLSLNKHGWRDEASSISINGCRSKALSTAGRLRVDEGSAGVATNYAGASSRKGRAQEQVVLIHVA